MAGDSDDILVGTTGGETLDGGGGNDTVDYSQFVNNVTVSLLTGQGEHEYSPQNTLVSIENIIGSAFHDHLHGDNQANVLRGDGGYDWIYGEGGDDRLHGGAGQDNFVLGAGADVVVLEAGDGYNIVHDFTPGVDKIDISAVGQWTSWEINQIEVLLRFDGNVALLIKNLTRSLTADDFIGLNGTFQPGPPPPPPPVYERTLTGTIGANTLTGDGRSELIQGIGGNDTLYGLGGADRLEGGADGDKLYGGDGDDVLSGGTGTNTMTGGAGADIYVMAAGAGNNTIADFAIAEDRIDVSGYGGFYSIGGSATGARINFADGGYLTLTGVAWQSLTDAQFIGKAAVPVVIPPPPPPPPPPPTYDRTLVGTIGANTIAGDGRNELIQGLGGNDTLYGMGGADRLEGGEGGDKLFGGDGDDFLVGGAGQDTLNGGAGADVFVFGPGDGANTIADFQDGIDLIDVTGYGAYSSMVQMAGGAKIIFADGAYAILTGVQTSSLSAADFIGLV